MLRPRFPRIASISRVFKRNIHADPPPLQYNFGQGIKQTRVNDQGIQEDNYLLDAVATDLAWYQYQRLMLTRLNSLIIEGPDANLKTKEILIKYARQPELANAFNYASMAHNNHFFFDGITDVPTKPSEAFQKELESSFQASMDSIREHFVQTANGMFGPGFVWLVSQKSGSSFSDKKTSNHKYGILTTYHAGSPYPGAHYRMQTKDMNTENEESSVLGGGPVNTVGMIGHKSEMNRQELLGGFNHHDAIVPLLCLNTWEHVWLLNYGIAGKRRYADNWWSFIDWKKVEEKAVGRSFQGC